jgi:hypothetical protein
VAVSDLSERPAEADPPTPPGGPQRQDAPGPTIEPPHDDDEDEGEGEE